MSCIEQLTESAQTSLFTSIFSKNYFLWIGSGFSYNFGFGSWNGVLQAISNEIGYPLKLNTSNPLKAAELLCSFASSQHGYDEYQFNSLVAKILLDSKKEIPDPDWTQKFREFSPNMIVTTNWDSQLEKIYDGLVNVVVRKDKSPQISNKGKNLFKIHGDAGRPGSIVVTQSQYFSFQREDTYLNRKIYTLFSEASPIFIGYSLTDPNIGFLYDEVYAHLGEAKPPAYMIVHPSVEDAVLDESKLLFNNKNIHIIKAEIGEFLEDLADAYKVYKSSTKRFLDEHRNILPRITEIVGRVKENKPIENDVVLGVFNAKDSRHQAVSAFSEILSNQALYKEFGGDLLAPENRMSYSAIEKIIGAVIWLVGKSGYPSNNVRDAFHKAVLKLCSQTDGVWDFYTAETPFWNILRITPPKESESFRPRIYHILDILRWSAPSEVGKCWSTWNVYLKHLEWINANDIDAILDIIESEANYLFRPSDKRWLLKLLGSKHCTDINKKRISALTE